MEWRKINDQNCACLRRACPRRGHDCHRTGTRLERKLKIINETSYDMVRYYGSNVGADSWQEDILGSDILYSGKSVSINFDDRSGYCVFDFKAVFSDGDEIVSERINVCEVGTYRYSD